MTPPTAEVLVSFSCYRRLGRLWRTSACFSFFQLLHISHGSPHSAPLCFSFFQLLQFVKGVFAFHVLPCFSFFQLLPLADREYGWIHKVLVSFSCYYALYVSYVIPYYVLVSFSCYGETTSNSSSLKFVLVSFSCYI